MRHEEPVRHEGRLSVTPEGTSLAEGTPCVIFEVCPVFVELLVLILEEVEGLMGVVFDLIPLVDGPLCATLELEGWMYS